MTPSTPIPLASSLIEPAEAQGAQHITCGFNTLSRCRHGWMLYHTADHYVGCSLHKYGEFSQGEVDIFAQLLGPGNVVVEAGANFGAHTVAMAQMVGPQGAIYAFEPQRLVYQVLTANIALNSLPNVFTMHAGLGAQDGSVRVPILDPAHGHNFGGFSIGGHPHGEEVPLLTVDSMRLAQCRMIKVDVEGMEYEVLEGARETIARLRPVLYVENDRPDLSPRLISLIQAMDYRLWWHAILLYNPDNFRGEPENVFGNTINVNMLCVPSEQAGAIQMQEIHTPQDRWQPAGA